MITCVFKFAATFVCFFYFGLSVTETFYSDTNLVLLFPKQSWVVGLKKVCFVYNPRLLWWVELFLLRIFLHKCIHLFVILRHRLCLLLFRILLLSNKYFFYLSIVSFINTSELRWVTLLLVSALPVESDSGYRSASLVSP